jgi:hypothetical protein
MYGYLCLSLLGAETKMSVGFDVFQQIFLQVLVSIQGLVLIAKPYLMVLPPKRPSGETCCPPVFYLSVINP